MQQLTRFMIRSGCLLAASAGLLCVPLESQADDEAVIVLHDCGSIEDSTARLACYDALQGEQQSERIAPATPPQSAPTVEAAADVDYAPLTDTVGKEALGGKDKEPEPDILIRATVVSCTKDSLDKFYFHFDNGQVWKRKDSNRTNLKDCSFSATITKDFFGYKLQREGEKKRIRISRVK